MVDPTPVEAGNQSGVLRTSLSIRLLGAIDVEVAGRRQAVSARTQLGLVLCALAQRSNERVSTAELSALLWPDSAPASYRNVIQVVVSKLRALVDTAGPDTEVAALNDGYVLRCPADTVDTSVFDSLVATAFHELSNGRAARRATCSARR